MDQEQTWYYLGRLNQRWRAHCATQNINPRSALRDLVRSHLSDGQAPQVPARKARLGGPKKPFLLRVTPDELSAIDAKAEAFGTTRTGYLLHVIHAALEGINVVPFEVINELAEANRQLAAIGRNLNQIAKLSHVTGEDMATRQTLLDLANSLKVHRANMAELGRCILQKTGC